MKHSVPFIVFRLLVVFSTFYSLVVSTSNSARPVLAAAKMERSLQDSPEDISFDGRFGINNVNRTWTLTGPIILDANRVGDAKALGASWNRVNLWWHDVEEYNGVGEHWSQSPLCRDYPGNPTDPSGYVPTEPTNWNWDRYNDLFLNYSLDHTLFILQGVPQCWQTWKDGGQGRIVYPALLDQKIFIGSDGVTDEISDASGINPQNPWANFVYHVVTHFGFEEHLYLQLWNEPLAETPDGGGPYWPGSNLEFARLVTVTYHVAQYAVSLPDVTANVHLVMPGLSDAGYPGVADETTTLLRDLAPYLNYFDFFATHDYNKPWRAVTYPDLLSIPAKPFWVTEFGTDEHFESPTVDRESARASAILQTLVYLLAKGKDHNIERFFQFQLDNSGNVDAGLLWGDFPTYDQYKREAYTATLQANIYLGNAWPVHVESYNRILWDPTPEDYSDVDYQEVNFTSDEYKLITVLWSTSLEPAIQACVPALDPDRQAELVWQDGEKGESPIEAVVGNDGKYCYPVELPAAINTVVGGKTAFLLQGKRDESSQLPPPPPNPCDVQSGFENGIACGLQYIRDTLHKHGVEVTVDDPPIPGMLFATTPVPLSTGGATTQVSATANHGTASIAASLTTSHTVLYGDLNTTWASDAWLGAQFTALSAPQAELYDEQDNLIATGAVRPNLLTITLPSRWHWETPSPIPLKATAAPPSTPPPPPAWA